MLEGFAVKAQVDGIVVDGEPCVDGLDDIEFAVLETLKDLESDARTLMNLIEGLAAGFASATQFLGQREIFAHSVSWEGSRSYPADSRREQSRARGRPTTL